MPRRQARHLALLALLALALLPLAVPGAAKSTAPALTRLSYDPVPGDYTLLLRVDNFHLVPYNASAPSQADEGHLKFLLNGYPCTAECARGQPYLSNQTRFVYHRLVTGDNITVELRHNDDTPVLVEVMDKPKVAPTSGNQTNQTGNQTADQTAPPTYHMAPVRITLIVASRGVRCVDTTDQGACLRWETIGPFLAITSGVPNAGNYRLTVRVDRFNLVAPDSGNASDPDTGHILFTRNGVLCDADCSTEEPAATTQTNFTFHGVKVGDRLGAELVRSDGASLVPRTTAVVVVAKPALRIVSGVPQEGDYTMRVNVTGFTLQAPGGPTNAGMGSIVYFLKRGTDFVTMKCGKPAETASTSFKFCDLKEGDTVGVALVDAQGEALDPEVVLTLTVLKKPQDSFITPGIGPAVALLLLGLAAIRRR